MNFLEGYNQEISSERLLFVNRYENLKKERSKMKKNLTIFLLAVLVISSVGLAVSVANASMSSMGFERSSNGLERSSMSNRLIQRSWVRIQGVITHWGTTDVRGSLFAWAKTAIHNTTG